MADETEQPPNIQTEAGDSTVRGAVVEPVYTERHVMHYAVTDHELSSIANLNTQTTIFASVGSFLLAVGISIVVALLVEDENADITLSLVIVTGIAFFLSACVYGLAYQAFRARNSELDSIRGEATK